LSVCQWAPVVEWCADKCAETTRLRFAAYSGFPGRDQPDRAAEPNAFGRLVRSERGLQLLVCIRSGDFVKTVRQTFDDSDSSHERVRRVGVGAIPQGLIERREFQGLEPDARK